MFGDTASFLGLWLQKPLRIAAFTPNNRRLAGACIACVWRNLPPARIWAYSAVGD